MLIQDNKIMFKTHMVVCDPDVASADYLLAMSKLLCEDGTPREHACELRSHNNDGTWGIKKLTAID